MKTKAKKYLLISIFMFSILMAGCKANVDIQEPKEAKTEQAKSDEMVDLQEDIVNSERTDDSDTEEFSVSSEDSSVKDSITPETNAVAEAAEMQKKSIILEADQELETANKELSVENTDIAVEEESTEITYPVTDSSYTGYATTALNIRKGPSTTYPVVGGYSMGQEVSVTGVCDNSWLRVDMNGTEAFCSGKYVSIEPVQIPESSPEAAPEEAISSSSAGIAESYAGADQKWVNMINSSLACVPSYILDAFVADGWHIYATSENIGQMYFGGAIGSVRGVTTYADKTIKIECRDVAVKTAPVHEIGHYWDNRCGWPSDSTEFVEIYNEEVGAFKAGIPNSSCVSSANEMFAEGFYYYLTNPSKLTPRLQEFLSRYI